MASPSQPKGLNFDLEVAPGKADQPDRIFMVGALRLGIAAEQASLAHQPYPNPCTALSFSHGQR